MQISESDNVHTNWSAELYLATVANACDHAHTLSYTCSTHLAVPLICMAQCALKLPGKNLINPRRMRGGYGSHRVCLSVPALAVTCLVYKYQLRCCRVPYGVTNVCIVWISKKCVVQEIWRYLLTTRTLDAFC